ncbi:MAG: hypothetical protein F9K24_04510 [Leptonema illini]|jgi:hypothetical protein|uniref:Uncharacterized protein n=1 Tax=Leptonema illini TaxID=183 RepID=A0A833H3L5_9LEPT|nr:MAG: hypothetical protein F9K24_04510 [Leptonema illini]PKL32707.1 MAG: hypothetical protein CVV45_11345 [Spirochaetae bacterium HGW-Spirochaetae-10]
MTQKQADTRAEGVDLSVNAGFSGTEHGLFMQFDEIVSSRRDAFMNLPPCIKTVPGLRLKKGSGSVRKETLLEEEL